MIVYHGSDAIVDHPDVDHSYFNLDFGRGFYVTTVREQAEKWTRRKASLSQGREKAILNVDEMKEDFSGFAFKDFEDDLEKWIDFVCQRSDGEEGYRAYDLVKGKVANDKVFRVVDM